MPLPKKFPTVLLAALLLAHLALAAPITEQGEKLAAYLDSLKVEDYWLSGAIVDWRTGLPTGQPIKDEGKHTHCSQFAAAACERLGIYLLRPPEHRAVLLANAQYDWLTGEGHDKGWSPVPDASTAQALANGGTLVIAIYKNPDSKKTGHIALIRPSNKSEEQIKAEGPQVTQAGGTNASSTTLRRGFANHPTAFANGEIRYFSHETKF